MTISDFPGPVNTIVPHPHVVLRKGEAFVSGTSVRIARLYELFRGGIEVARILKRYPNLKPAQVFDALSFAVDNRHLYEP